jgi:hypothetical protein
MAVSPSGGLSEPEQVALAVEEERPALARALARIVIRRDDDLVGHLEAGHVEGRELQSARPQVGYGLVEVLDLKPHLCRAARSLTG